MLWKRRPPLKVKLARGTELGFNERPLIMGVLNVTPDSFSDGGSFNCHEKAVKHGLEMIKHGADIIDVGGESTRPGSMPVDEKTEIERTLPVIKDLTADSDIPVSIDTQKSKVAESAVEAGAVIINDVSAMRTDEDMPDVVSSTGSGLCLMHMQGTPANMQANPRYDDVVADIKDWLSRRIDVAMQAGVDRESIIVDPGFGFGKTVGHNLEILRRLSEFHSLGRPLLLGTSRKSTIGAVLNKTVDARLSGSLATYSCGLLSGAHILRVHDVEETRDVVTMTEAILRGELWDG